MARIIDLDEKRQEQQLRRRMLEHMSRLVRVTGRVRDALADHDANAGTEATSTPDSQGNPEEDPPDPEPCGMSRL
ncbi:MAG: hypothetical protein ABIJ09_11065 [Pseudomonadota bacterium]